MSEIAIRCEGLGKRYRLGTRERYRALRETITDTVRAPLRRLRSTLGQGGAGQMNGGGTLWALRDVSFEMRQGEVLGIIGANGAGKSTLLKILSRITKPTTGTVEINGRVGSLLEVGTGFHPELTGRENIYLNGAILGMKRAEIERKFDEIVAFAEVEQFLDTPVKRFSSGMYVRLAFAVAVHLEPEILIIDEVLAVGDAQFQKKCFEKIKGIGRGGRTILFVSHNMYAVRSICNRGLALERGRIVNEGAINGVVDSYLAKLNEPAMGTLIETESFSVQSVQISSTSGPVIKTFDDVEISVRFTAKADIQDPGLYIGVLTIDSQRLTGLDFKDFKTIPPIRAGQSHELGFTIEGLPLLSGTYQLELYLKDMASHTIELVPKTFPFEIVETPIYGGRQLDNWYGHLGLNARARSNEHFN